MYTPLTKEQYDSAVKSGFSSQDIITMEKKRKALAEEKPGYFSAVAKDYSKAADGIVTGVKQSADEVQQGLDKGGLGGAADVVKGLARGSLRTVGGVAEAAFAPITEAPIIKPTLEAAGTGISKIPGVDVIVQKAQELAQKHPLIAKDLKNIIDIATLGGGKTAEKPLGVVAEKAGTALEASGKAALEASNKSFLQDLVKPIESKAEKISQVGRTSEKGSGIFKRSVVAPTGEELKMAEELSQIPGVVPKNTIQQNFNIIKDFNFKEADKLKQDIANFDFKVPKEELLSKLEETSASLQQHPLIVGDAAVTADRLIKGAKQFIEKNAESGSGILQARKEYDNWVLSQKPKAFDAAAENSFTVANREVRKTINNFLDEKAPNLGIKDSLRKQSTLYNAMENLAPKAAEEANTAIGRAMQGIGKTLSTKNKIVQALAAVAGIGGLGAAATFAPAAAVVGGTSYVVYKAGKLILNPEVRILFGKLLQQSGRALNSADKKVIEETLKNLE